MHRLIFVAAVLTLASCDDGDLEEKLNNVLVVNVASSLGRTLTVVVDEGRGYEGGMASYDVPESEATVLHGWTCAGGDCGDAETKTVAVQANLDDGTCLKRFKLVKLSCEDHELNLACADGQCTLAQGDWVEAPCNEGRPTASTFQGGDPWRGSFCFLRGGIPQ